MPRTRRRSATADKADARATALSSINPALELGESLTLAAYKAKITATRTALECRRRVGGPGTKRERAGRSLGTHVEGCGVRVWTRQRGIREGRRRAQIEDQTRHEIERHGPEAGSVAEFPRIRGRQMFPAHRKVTAPVVVR